MAGKACAIERPFLKAIAGPAIHMVRLVDGAKPQKPTPPDLCPSCERESFTGQKTERQSP